MATQRILIKGRLGNQMFIYAFARALSFEAHTQPILLMDWLEKHHIANRLDCFVLSPEVKFSKGKKMSLLQKVVLFVAKKIIHWHKHDKRYAMEIRLRTLLSKFGLYFITDGYMPLPEQRMLEAKDFYMEGYFQSLRYFSKYKQEILKDFRFIPSVIDSCRDIATQIINSNEPTCLHVRLGDYVNHSLHEVADARYYITALKQLKALKPEAQVFLFSDNISLAKKELNLGENVICIPEKYNDQQNMYLGSLCHNFIMSNSSFSWWMQYLSKYEDKVIFAPSRWYSKDIPCDIYLNDWHLIEV